MLGLQRMQAATIAAAMCVVCGCGRSDGPTRVAVGGQVDRAGAPVAEATISFSPIGPEGGPAAMTSVTDGKYQFQRRQGPPPGKHRVLVVSASSGKRERFETSPGDANSRAADRAAAAAARWETEVEVPAAESCDLPIHLK